MMNKYFFSILFLILFFICTVHASEKVHPEKTRVPSKSLAEQRLENRANLLYEQRQEIDAEFERNLRAYLARSQNTKLGSVSKSLKKGANPDIFILGGADTGKNSGSPLQISCWLGRLSLSRLLLQYGASPHSTDNFDSPLHAATKRNHHEQLQLLLNAKADPNEPIFLLRKKSLLELDTDTVTKKLLIRAGAMLPPKTSASEPTFEIYSILQKNFMQQQRPTYQVTSSSTKDGKTFNVTVKKIDTPSFEEHLAKERAMREEHRKQEFSKRFPGLLPPTQPFE